MPNIRPTVLFPVVQGDNFSRDSRWARERTTRYVSSHVVSLFRDALTKMGVDEVLKLIYNFDSKLSICIYNRTQLNKFIIIVYLGAIFYRPYCTAPRLFLNRTSHIVVSNSVDILEGCENSLFTTDTTTICVISTDTLPLLTQTRIRNYILQVVQTVLERIEPSTIVIECNTRNVVLNRLLVDIAAIH